MLFAAFSAVWKSFVVPVWL